MNLQWGLTSNLHFYACCKTPRNLTLRTGHVLGIGCLGDFQVDSQICLIILRDKRIVSKGNKFFQLCALSHTNSGMNDNDFIAKNEQHLFDKSFRFKAKYTNEKARQKDDPTKNFSALPRTGPTSPSNTRYINYAGLVSGLIEKGHTKDMTKMSKGEPDKKWTNKDGSVVWWYADGTEITFSKKGIATKVKMTSNPSK